MAGAECRFPESSSIAADFENDDEDEDDDD